MLSAVRIERVAVDCSLLIPEFVGIEHPPRLLTRGLSLRRRCGGYTHDHQFVRALFCHYRFLVVLWYRLRNRVLVMYRRFLIHTHIFFHIVSKWKLNSP